MSTPSGQYELIYAPQVVAHIRAIAAKYHGLIRTTVEEQLTHAPQVETRNRKPIVQPAPFEAMWGLRFGPGNRFRVFYEIVNRTIQRLIKKSEI